MIVSASLGSTVNCGASLRTSLSMEAGALTSTLGESTLAIGDSDLTRHSGTSACGQVTELSMRRASRWPWLAAAKNRYEAQSSRRVSPRPCANNQASWYCDSASPRRAMRHRSATACGLLRAITACEVSARCGVT